MKSFLFVAIFLCSSMGAYAQTPEVKLPAFCKSDDSDDKKKCELWHKEMKKFQAVEENVPSFCKSSAARDQKKCEEWHKNNKTFADIGYHENFIKCSRGDLTPEEQKSCDEWSSSSKNIQDSGTGIDSKLLNCHMQENDKEIVCGEKVYELTGKVNNVQRMKDILDIKKSKARLKKLRNGNGHQL